MYGMNSSDKPKYFVFISKLAEFQSEFCRLLPGLKKLLEIRLAVDYQKIENEFFENQIKSITVIAFI